LNGVKDIIAAFGAVDISNVRTAQDKEPEQLAQSVADSAVHYMNQLIRVLLHSSMSGLTN